MEERDLEKELGLQVIPIDALFDEGCGPNIERDPRQLMADAQLIFGRDVMTRHQFLVYGLEETQRISSSNKAAMRAGVMIELDQETDELEKLLALVLTVKGRHDYS